MANSDSIIKGPDTQTGSREHPIFNADYDWLLALLAGAGFACGIGWLWFGELAELWLPHFLWGSIFSGGGASLFYLLLSLGFFALFILAGQADKRPSAENNLDLDWRLGRLPHLVQGASFFMVIVAILWPGIRPALSYGPVVCLAAAGLLQALYWGGLILSMAPRQALAGMIFAALGAILLYILCSLFSSFGREMLLIVLMPTAWAMAREFGVILRRQKLAADSATPPKRPRGRPSMKVARPVERIIPEPDQWFFALSIIGFFLLVAGQVASDYGQDFKNPALSLLFGTFGFLLVLVLSASMAWPQMRLTILPTALAALSLLLEGFFLLLGLAFWPGFLTSGLFYGTVLASLSRPEPFNVKTLRRTAFILGLMTALGNLAAWSAGQLKAAWGPMSASRLCGFICLTAAAFFIVKFWPEQRRLIQPDEPQPLTPELLLELLSAREKEIASLAMTGLRNKDISDQLCVSDETIRFHLRNIYQKSGLPNRPALVALGRKKPAINKGIV